MVSIKVTGVKNPLYFTPLKTFIHLSAEKPVCLFWVHCIRVYLHLQKQA